MTPSTNSAPAPRRCHSTAASTFIRSERGGLPSRGGERTPRGGFGGNFNSKVRDMIGDLKSCMR